MDPTNTENQVPQLLAQLALETDRLGQLTEDIRNHAITPQAKAALERIGNELNIVLQILSVSVEPLYALYETDLGMMNSKMLRDAHSDAPTPGFDPNVPLKTEEYDENALWNEVSSTTRE
jgi:hypothetical protein